MSGAHDSSFDHIVEVIAFAGLADENAQPTSGSIDLDTAHQQPSISGSSKQSRSLAAFEARGTAHALLG
jgi:hypothetical protein